MPEKRLQTVYVVDDEPIISSTFATILNGSGYSALAFTSAEEAIREASKAAESGFPDFLLSDVSMPGMNGVDLAILFRKASPNCRILLFSGALSSAGILENARRLGYEFPLLAVPVHPNDLLAAIRGL
jgi:CheY-like chemotaxis protein